MTVTFVQNDHFRHQELIIQIEETEIRYIKIDLLKWGSVSKISCDIFIY